MCLYDFDGDDFERLRARLAQETAPKREEDELDICNDSRIGVKTGEQGNGRLG
jgi:hypothetical protein